ncbi:thiosulfate sulfurtransferase [Photobacterium aquae]|uniref:Thiosulfate sulfurtransferase n=1 Tax=Photobacterium aquae TaxID=1195763 RepID=A0A0J1K3D1_9GAMM|nr:rhodanese-like domain-containing protein [Photobacterium aquae]KLV08922.1 thiosulfate sulfurtransferase [Photobacterium aquae]
MKTLLNAAFCTAIAFTPKLSAATFDQLVADKQPDRQIIDCRSSNYYNGWPEAGQHKGGHIPGAINFDSDWLSTLRPQVVRSELESRGIDFKQRTTLYCSTTKAAALKSQLNALGKYDVEVITQPVEQYPDKLAALENYQQLVPASWLHQLIEGQSVSHAPAKGFKVVEVAWGPPAKYLASHIPTALYLNTNNIESEPWWNHVDNDQLGELLRELGISHDTTVILYGRDNTAAARAANIMMYAGVEDVRLLNGGWKSWINAGYPTQALLNSTEPVDFGRPIPAHPEYIIDIQGAKEILADQDNQSLVSIRSWAEYIGETSGYKYIDPKGRISGSKWGHAGSDAYSLEDFRNPDDTMISEDLITKFWKDWNIHKNQNVSFYCGTGWRASEVFFYAHVMGWKHISVFDGGWFEWSGDPANPVEHGEIPNAPISTHHTR